MGPQHPCRRHAELRLGRKVEPIAVVELADADKPAVIREYLRRWKAEVGQFFDGINERSTDDELLAVAAGFPVAVNLTILAAEYRQDEALATQSIFLTTLLSAATVAVLILLVR